MGAQSFSVTEAVADLGISRPTLIRALKAKRIHAVRRGRLWSIPSKEMERVRHLPRQVDARGCVHIDFSAPPEAA